LRHCKQRGTAVRNSCNVIFDRSGEMMFKCFKKP
jgi:hypothetical protein